MAEMRQMDADLMRPTGVKGAFHQRVGPDLLKDPPTRLRQTAARRRDHSHLHPMDGMSSDGRFDNAALGGESPDREAKIYLAHLPPGELTRDAVMSEVVLRGDDAPARLLVQTMDNPGTLLAAN